MAYQHQNRSQISCSGNALAGIVREVAETWSRTADSGERNEAMNQAAARVWDVMRPQLKFYSGENAPASLMDRINNTLLDMGRAWDAVDGSSGAKFHKPANGIFYLDTDDEDMKGRFQQIMRNAAIGVLMDVAEHEDLRAWADIMWSHNCWAPRKEDYIRPEDAPHYEYVGFPEEGDSGAASAGKGVAARVSDFFAGVRGIRLGSVQATA